jgi:hypothetical protein
VFEDKCVCTVFTFSDGNVERIMSLTQEGIQNMDKVRILKEKKRECVGNQDGLERGSDDADKEAG